MEERSNLPDANRLSVLAATILLAYALTRYIDIPRQAIAFQLPGVYLDFPINFGTLVSLIVAGLAVAGADWLLRDHPARVPEHGTTTQPSLSVQHLILPGLTAWLIGVPLQVLPSGPQWWLVFGLGGGLFMLVLMAEYIVLDATDYRQPVAAAGLAALSFALFLMLAIAVRSALLRLYLLLPTLWLAAGVVSLRTLYLRRSGNWALAWAFGIAFIAAQVAIGLHYLPVSPVRYGLLLTGIVYALTSAAGSFGEGKPLPRLVGEPALMLAVLWFLAVWLG